MEMHHKTHLRDFFGSIPTNDPAFSTHHLGDTSPTPPGQAQASAGPTEAEGHEMTPRAASLESRALPGATVQDPSCCHLPHHLFSPFMVLPSKAISQGSPREASKAGLHKAQLKATTLPWAPLLNHDELGCLENKSPAQRIPARLEWQPRVLIQSQTQ